MNEDVWYEEREQAVATHTARHRRWRKIKPKNQSAKAPKSQRAKEPKRNMIPTDDRSLVHFYFVSFPRRLGDEGYHVIMMYRCTMYTVYKYIYIPIIIPVLHAV
jgi:hypothetical protein